MPDLLVALLYPHPQLYSVVTSATPAAAIPLSSARPEPLVPDVGVRTRNQTYVLGPDNPYDKFFDQAICSCLWVIDTTPQATQPPTLHSHILQVHKNSQATNSGVY